MEITGAALFVKALEAEGVDMVFGYPGGQAIDLFDALYDHPAIEVILPRHEQGLAHAADGYARATGKAGICLVTSGPGATNLVTGIATANYDSVPLVCFTGQVATGLLGKQAFQEVDIVSITESITKYAVTVLRREDLAGEIRKAFCLAKSGKPGAVVVDIPKDVQQALGSDAYRPSGTEAQPESPAAPDHTWADEAAGLLAAARRPLILAGGGVHIAGASAALQAFAQKTGIPVVTTIMGKGALPTKHPLYAGNIGIHGSFAANSAVSACDVLLAVGTRFNDRITGRTAGFAKNAKLIHIDIEPSVLSRNVPACQAITMDAGKALSVLEQRVSKAQCRQWCGQINAWRTQHPLSIPENGLTPRRVIEAVNTLLPDTIVVTDVGQNQLWTTQFLEHSGGRRLITSGGLGTMGYGLPAAIGASLGNPGSRVVAIMGDGGLQMVSQELATAVVYGLPVIICVFNNGWLGNVRQWQELFYAKRYSSTCLRARRSCRHRCSGPSAHCPEYTPDFVRLAESYGLPARRVTREEDVEPAFTDALSHTAGPVLIEFMLEAEANVLPIVPPGNALDEMEGI
ncbi:biosynthetic-type acetolactate synthase large subunit [Eubacterium sp. 1001713B170207_170306_E7]|uniref:biosynthetic-type acetolactate synthase large subunit n=1 Tax=Eubacterium sp. 1001713B170207_170306_E7 TaxID=2787097 RepID=UPI00189919DB|nr:biosynthetic-type acetolactate synthase large subunit [Eubacterium sp. 1001713B170207_170306_E7]